MEDFFVYFLFSSLIYLRKAIVIEGVSGLGALMSQRKPAAVAALSVELPKTAILVSFCSKSGKFFNKDSIPDGLKKTRIS